MGSSKNINVGKEVIRIEAEAVKNLQNRIDSSFDEAVNLIFNCKGRVIVTGMGKSGLISQKIASTLASTGTPAQFIHPGEAIHGDLGMITKNDIVLAISYGGETLEIVQMMPAISRLGVKVIVFVGRMNSTITDMADVVINTSVDREACTLDLAPTASTTATMAMGDALAVALLEKRGFQQEDFALLHPGGSLGKKLLLTVKEIMHRVDELAIVDVDMDIQSTLLTISAKRLGVAIVTENNGKLSGIITDGDIRRGLEQGGDIFAKTAEFLMTKNPKWVTEDTLAINALEKMEKYSITSLFVYKGRKNDRLPNGIVHIHDILKSGIM
ncbi:MAG: KpsF/GutQ family sugar-phosphate isomerase [Candidatus Marinimicrobia bacterium]|nr:KpsF/GutQ family sugar-phosphate isomerase [Candidatus Neomarinimicrobiota bacterium]